MTDATPTLSVDPDDAATLMRWAGLPLEPDRAPGLAERLSRSRAGLRALDRFIDRTTEPLGLHLPSGE
jgi:hypothetical protein